ncbi:MAG: hypothetical protein IBX68_03945 [Dehalococcoidia bacterium]|nr:hypothetical protein [Dehalococcoidia bacterium]
MGLYLRLALVIILLLAIPVGCGSQGTEQQSAVDRAIAKAGQVQSYRSDGNSTIIDESGEVMSASFTTEVAAPDRFYSKTIGDQMWLEAVKDGDRCYFREGEGESWRSCEEEIGQDNQTLEDVEMPMAGAIALLAYMKDIKELDQEDVDGVTCRRYRGEIDTSSYIRALAEATGETPPAEDELAAWKIDVNVWIDEDDYVRKMDIDTLIPSMVAGQGEISMRSSTRFYDFGAAIEIVLPQVQ